MEIKDPRGPEPFDYVAEMKNMNETSRKNDMIRLKWSSQYEWLCDEYKSVLSPPIESINTHSVRRESKQN